MGRKTKCIYYDDWFKTTAVELGELPGVQAQDVADVLDIHYKIGDRFIFLRRK